MPGFLCRTQGFVGQARRTLDGQPFNQASLASLALLLQPWAQRVLDRMHESQPPVSPRKAYFRLMSFLEKAGRLLPLAPYLRTKPWRWRARVSRVMVLRRLVLPAGKASWIRWQMTNAEASSPQAVRRRPHPSRSNFRIAAETNTVGVWKLHHAYLCAW